MIVVLALLITGAAPTTRLNVSNVELFLQEYAQHGKGPSLLDLQSGPHLGKMKPVETRAWGEMTFTARSTIDVRIERACVANDAARKICIDDTCTTLISREAPRGTKAPFVSRRVRCNEDR